MYNEIFNKPEKKGLRSRLRNDQTEAERILWNQLRRRQVEGQKFRRQHGLGKYIVDFYCPSLLLIIEIDGDTHSTESEIKYDKIREQYLVLLGCSILRFTNNDVYDSLNDVVETIRKKVLDLKFR